MKRGKFACALFGALLLVAVPISQAADEWDNANENDDSATGTDSTLVHGTSQRHSLQAKAGPTADQDWYRIVVEANRSYEVIAKDVTGDTNLASTDLQRYNSAGTTLQQSAVGIGSPAFAWTLRWIEDANAVDTIRVLGATNSTFYSFYTITFRETTLYCPRFNNSGSQVSVLILQAANPSAVSSCSYRLSFVNEGGTLLHTVNSLFNFLDDVDVFSLAGISQLAGQRGAAFVAHNCGFGGVKAKLVALEPATGFSFDTQCTPREY